MPKVSTVRVRVPATSANLGPGFDCLGLSLDLWNEIDFSLTGKSLQIDIEGEGADELPRDANNLMYQCLQILANEHQAQLPSGIRIRCHNRIPIASGLGSSSSAIIAALLAGRVLLGIDCPDHDLLELGYRLEGHLDNLAACLYGGLTISMLHDQKVRVKRITPQEFSVVIALPDVKLITRDARRVLPESIPLEDAVFNISRTAWLVCALAYGEVEQLSAAMHDRLHQPYRYNLIPGAREALTAAIQAGALGSALSGAGPGLMAFLRQNDEGEVADAMKQSFKNQDVNALIIYTRTTNLGAEIIN